MKNSGGTSLKTYKYDALGRRVTETPNGGSATDLYYSTHSQVLEERVAGTARVQNVWGLGYIDAMVLRDRDSDSNGSLEERLYVQQDANWNITSLVNTSGTVVERYLYDPYGKQTVLNGVSGSDGDGVVTEWTTDGGGTSDWAFVYAFQGGRVDSTTGDVYFRNRDYDIDMGRWKSADPLGYPDGANRYEYEGDSTIGSVEPEGLNWFTGGISTIWHGVQVGTAVAGAVASYAATRSRLRRYCQNEGAL